MKVKSTILAEKTVGGDLNLKINDLDRVKEEIYNKLMNHDCYSATFNVAIDESIYKTSSQLGYFHAEVLPKLLFAYKETGERVSNEHAAKSLLKAHYGYFETIQVDNQSFNSLKSFEYAKMKEMTDIIDFAISICLDCGIEVVTPEQYLRSRGLIKFTK